MRLAAFSRRIVAACRAKMTSMDSVAVDRFTAFPLSISAAAVEDGWAVDATAARACDLIDVLGGNTGPTTMILNVVQIDWLDNDGPWPLRRIAERQHVPAAVSDSRWASLGPDFDNDLLVISWSDLPRLLDGWSPIGIGLFDQPSPRAATDELVLTVKGRRIGTRGVARKVTCGFAGSGVRIATRAKGVPPCSLGL